jgi:hypothetical protein
MRKAVLKILVVALIAVAVPHGIALAQPGSGAYDDTNALLSYSGNWTLGNTSTYANAMNGTVHYTQDSNASVSFTFTGSTITLFYTAASNRGSISVSISNVFPSISETFSAQLSEVRRQAAKTWAVPLGDHTITVRPNCSSICLIDVDAFAVNIATSSIGEYDDYHTALNNRYIGPWSSTMNASTSTIQHSLHWSDTPGSLFRFTFTGNQIGYVFSRGPDRGNALITIDGIDKGSIAEYSSDTSYPRQYSVVYRGLGSGVHNINVTISSASHPASSGHRVDLDALEVPNCPGSLINCRAYSRVFIETNNDYTAVSGNLSAASPAIRDSTATGAFSSEVFWIGQRCYTVTICTWFEGGWRRELGKFNNATFAYWQYYKPGINPVSGQLPNININYIAQYRIESHHGGNLASSNCDWHMYYAGIELTPDPPDIGICAGSIRIGGEVTDASATLHNAMGPSTFSSLQYNRNFGNWQAWNGWDFQLFDYSYTYIPIGPDSYANSGYN